jgi:hypothetical protein
MKDRWEGTPLYAWHQCLYHMRWLRQGEEGEKQKWAGKEEKW